MPGLINVCEEPKVEGNSSSIAGANIFNIFDDLRLAPGVRPLNAMSSSGQRLIMPRWTPVGVGATSSAARLVRQVKCGHLAAIKTRPF
jgi:hypothetical protein